MKKKKGREYLGMCYFYIYREKIWREKLLERERKSVCVLEF